jgi:predicted HicB family RNase H-like nuclease
MTRYKGYIGQFFVDVDTGLIRGTVVNTRDVITFHGSTVQEAQQAFRDSVDEYLAFCEELGRTPEKPYSGKLLVRIRPSLHRELEVLAKSRGKSVNAIISGCLARMARKLRVPAGGVLYGGTAPISVSKAQPTPPKPPKRKLQTVKPLSKRGKKSMSPAS